MGRVNLLVRIPPSGPLVSYVLHIFFGVGTDFDKMNDGNVHRTTIYLKLYVKTS